MVGLLQTVRQHSGASHFPTGVTHRTASQGLLPNKIAVSPASTVAPARNMQPLLKLWPLTVGASGIAEGIIATLIGTAILYVLGRLSFRLSGKVEIEFGPAGLSCQEPSLLTEPLPVDLDDVVRLISWQVELAPLVGRDRERAELLAWAENNGGPRVRIRLLTGPAGSGKSRLAADVAKALRARRFWRKWHCVGVVGKGRTRITSLPAFLIVDDPEDRRASVLEILETLAARNNEKRAIRVLLLSRDSQERWAKDLGAAKLKVAVDFQEVALAPLTADSAAELYEKVTSRLSKEYGEPERPFLVKEFNRWLSRDQLHHLPIYITAAAIHAVRDRDDRFALGGRTLIVRLAERELDRLRAVSTKQNGFGDESLPRLAALAVARDGLDVADVHRLAAADKAEGKKLALMLPDEATGIDVIDALKKLPWWSEGRWQIKAPGIVSAAILYEVLKDRKEDNASQWLWLAIQGLEGEHTARIGRLGYDIGEIYGAADADRKLSVRLRPCMAHN